MKTKIFNLIDKLRIAHIILIWLLVGFLFALLYLSLPGPLKKDGTTTNNFFDAIYFSFITMLTIGYGDIVIVGTARIFTIIEGLMGWIIFGIIVYKIISIKEDIILEEIHSMTVEETISRLRHYLFVSRTNIIRFVNDIASKTKIDYSNMFELSVISTTLEANISDAKDFLCRERLPFIKQISGEDVRLIIDMITIDISNFITALKILSNKIKITDKNLLENIKKICEHCYKISNYYKDKEIEKFAKELENFI